jgi:hypothetical protein
VILSLRAQPGLFKKSPKGGSFVINKVWARFDT